LLCPKMVLQRSQNDAKMKAKWSQNGPKMVPKWSQRVLETSSRRKRRQSKKSVGDLWFVWGDPRGRTRTRRNRSLECPFPRRKRVKERTLRDAFCMRWNLSKNHENIDFEWKGCGKVNAYKMHHAMFFPLPFSFSERGIPNYGFAVCGCVRAGPPKRTTNHPRFSCSGVFSSSKTSPGPSGTILEPFWVRFGTISPSFWHHFETVVRPFWDTTTKPPYNPTTQRPNNPTKQPNNPTDHQPDNPTTQHTTNPTTQRPNNPTQQPNNPTHHQPNNPTT
jgi:hypothetical protein